MDDEKKFDHRRNLQGYHQVPKLSKLNLHRSHRTMMVIGATGTGKTTTLNCMMNYLWDVKFDDKYRYKLIFEKTKSTQNQANSQTQLVSAYHLQPPKLDYQLTLIDTPGYGDTRGINRDKEITRNIKEFFDKQVQDIDAVCFVIRAPQARLTPTQKYIFAQVLKIFGKDIEENIFILLTFADGKKPPALAALKAGNVPYKKDFKLNNSAFDLQDTDSDSDSDDDSDDEDELASMLWRTSMKSFGKLFKAISEVETKSLQLTKEVLQRRKELECYVENIQPTINAGFTVLEDMRGQIAQLERFKDLVNANKNFTIERKVNEAEQVPNGGGCTTTCIQCNYTCHKHCRIPDNGKKDKCNAMRSDGNCINCPDKCHWTFHRNLPYTVVWKEVTKKETVQDLMDKYYDAKNKQDTVQQQLSKALNEEMTKHSKELYGLISSVRFCLNALRKIALVPNPLAQADYIDKLIKSEEEGKKPGWKNRIVSLKKLKQQQKIISDVSADDFNPFEKYDDVSDFVDKNKEMLTPEKDHKKPNNNSKEKPKKKGKGIGFALFGYEFSVKKS